MLTYEKKKIKYETKDTQLVFKRIKALADSYFASAHTKKYANSFMWFKCISIILVIGLAYYLILHSSHWPLLLFSYFLFGFSFLTLGINVGHDAAHHCLTGKKPIDNLIFQLVFGLQGLSGYFWQLRHNFSHHIFPNVNEMDSDLDLTPMILIKPSQKIYWFHKYQHLYAPFLYGLYSLAQILVRDVVDFFKKEHGNLTILRVPPMEWIKLILIKIVYLGTFIFIPYYFTDFSLLQIISTFLVMHFFLSIYLIFTFYISHHVTEVDYFDTLEEEPVVPSSWVQHQIITTIDFNPENKFANFLFGGFNLHIAHHIFPEVSHIHYPALTRIIKTTLEENNLDWYKSFTFFKGIRSHLLHLKNRAKELMNEEEEETYEEKSIEEEIIFPSYSRG